MPPNQPSSSSGSGEQGCNAQVRYFPGHEIRLFDTGELIGYAYDRPEAEENADNAESANVVRLDQWRRK